MYTFLVGDYFSSLVEQVGKKKSVIVVFFNKNEKTTAKSVLQEVLTFLSSMHFGDNAVGGVVWGFFGWWLVGFFVIFHCGFFLLLFFKMNTGRIILNSMISLYIMPPLWQRNVWQFIRHMSMP